jgi:type II secretory pathway component PulF
MAISATQRKVKKTVKEKSFLNNINKIDLKISLAKRISATEINLLTSQLSLMVELGTPLNVGLSSIERDVKNPALKKVIKEIVNDVEDGKFLSDSFEKFPHLFSDAYISLVRAGENTGQLKEMLDRVLAMQEKQEKFVDTLKKALTYPAILCFMSVSVVIFLLTYVFPRFSDLFKEISDILPVSTKILISMSNSMRSHWQAGAVILVLCVFGLYAFIQSRNGKLFIDTLKIRLPLLANIFIRVYLIQAMRSLGFLMSCNIPMLEALRIAQGGIKNLVFKEFLDTVAENVEGGRGLSLAFKESALIPENAKRIVRTGEDTQNIPKVMLRLSDYYEEELDSYLKKFTSIIEPVMLIMMGLVVGVIVISLILPIFKLSRAMH